MVSTAMQGGCTCENATLLRIGTGNVEFAALFAPKPLCLLSADDWTRDMPTKGYPELKHHFEMMGAGNHLLHRPLLHFGHNYNHVSRTVMYQWLNRHLELGLPEPVLERDFERLTAEELSVWNDEHPKPQSGPQVERQLLRWWAEDATAHLAKVQPEDEVSLKAYRDLVGGAIDAIIGRHLPDKGDLEFDEFDEVKENGYVETSGLLRNLKHDESLPVVLLMPEGWQKGRVAIWLDPAGKSGLYDGELPKTDVQLLLDKGVAVVGVDLLFQGEFLSGEPMKQTRRVNNSREAAAYTLGYNDSLMVRRVHDVLNVVGFVSQQEQTASEVWLLGLNGLAPVAASARAIAGPAVHRAVVDTDGFRFEDVGDIRDPHLMPGAAKYHDLPGILSLSAPHELWIAGEDEVGVSIVKQAYAAASAEDRLHLLPSDVENVSRTAVHSLLKSGK
jgi:hypothetical protein